MKKMTKGKSKDNKDRKMEFGGKILEFLLHYDYIKEENQKH